jgi:predicted phage tail protein
VGDVISISHDVPQWGVSGRILVGSTTTLVKLDQSVTIEVGKTYKILVGHNSDTIEERTITDGPGTYTEVNVSTAFSEAPGEFAKYAFGESGKVIKDFRVMQFKRVNEGEAEITAIEYNASIYDTDTIVLPTANASMLTLDIPDVTDLELTERIVKLNDGTIENIIDVWFNPPVTTGYQINIFDKAKIYLSDNTGVTWTFIGETSGRHFQIQGGIVDGKTYRIAVVSQSRNGKANAITDSPYSDITVAGKTSPPSDVTGFDVYQEGNCLSLAGRLFLMWIYLGTL